jgi:hypothetical protein
MSLLDPHVVSQEYFIEDVRTEFASNTFTNYHKVQIKKLVMEEMMKGKIENACHWIAELVCAGHFIDIWETLFAFYGKHIHIGNPKIAVYLNKRYGIFKNIAQQSFFYDALQLRNNSKVRQLFAEVVTLLTLTNKKQELRYIKIERKEEFDITNLTEKLKAPSVQYIPFFKERDPKELIIPLNEFSYHISAPEVWNAFQAFYWIEWVLEFDSICKKKKHPCICEHRDNSYIEKRYDTHSVWLLWDSIFYYGQQNQSLFIQNVLHSLYYLFCVKYGTSICQKRKYFLYMAVELLTCSVEFQGDLISKENIEIVQVAIKNINEIYKNIKKNEVRGRLMTF